MTLLDGDRLLAHVRHGRDTARSIAVKATYDGLETRITRGDYTLDTTPLQVYLARLDHAATEAADDDTGSVHLLVDWRDTALDALTHALELLGVRR